MKSPVEPRSLRGFQPLSGGTKVFNRAHREPFREPPVQRRLLDPLVRLAHHAEHVDELVLFLLDEVPDSQVQRAGVLVVVHDVPADLGDHARGPDPVRVPGEPARGVPAVNICHGCDLHPVTVAVDPHLVLLQVLDHVRNHPLTLASFSIASRASVPVSCSTITGVPEGTVTRIMVPSLVTKYSRWPDATRSPITCLMSVSSHVLATQSRRGSPGRSRGLVPPT